MRVLVVEDSRRLAHTLTLGLADAGMVIDAVGDGRLADQILGDEDYDAVVLDLALPRLDGMEVLRRVRARGDDVPVLILTASGEIEDRVRGLNAGADDYLSKPFAFDELVARLRAIGRRRSGHAHPALQIGRLEFDSLAGWFRLDGDDLPLPPRERAVLELLVLEAGRPVAKRALCERLCTLDEVLTTDAIEIYVHRLRKRLAGHGVAIRTLRGLGYLIEADTGAA